MAQGTVTPLEPIAALDVQCDLGTWYQAALVPNRFLAQCVSDTTASYRRLGEGALEVSNCYRDAAGELNEAIAYTLAAGVHVDGVLLPLHFSLGGLRCSAFQTTVHSALRCSCSWPCQGPAPSRC